MFEYSMSVKLLTDQHLEFLSLKEGCTGLLSLNLSWKSHVTAHIWALTRENMSSGVANNKSADQPAHPRNLFSAFVVCFLESIICKFATGKISFF